MLHQELNLNRAVVTQAFDYFVAYRTPSFEDCYLAVYARCTQAEPLYMFDHKFASHLLEAKLLT